ncbi:hypothetical protein FAUST_7283 [Fusarium austroamericanum]|uniref:DUF7779 domain-containing protein n=1 Tax=Fusarium austroamericanum TaxID=282268 RepID=A0AAN6BYE5_FUSAU|nr:hypothetical protein FAUST_7283 [Fusarium austroamericanum]
MTSKKKGPVFRVTGLPVDRPDEELNVALRTVIDETLSDGEKSQLGFTTTIVPSCYSDLERVALVEFHGGVPDFLSNLVANPLGDWQVEMDDDDISFDQHFFGFTQLYTPKSDAPVTADIIAITGLDGHAYGSWRGKGNFGRMWLRDFLSKDLPCCRTMTYGYNSKLSSRGIDTVMDYGRELIEELKKVRNSDELRQRPVFFVTHSFGGIILAHCLVKAVQTNEGDHPTIASLHKATYGMFLFGIPHKGLMVNDIEKMLAGKEDHPRSALLQQIRDKSDLLTYQLADFKNLIRDRKVISFYETRQTRQLEFNNETKRWERTGGFVTKVDTDSALLQLPDSMEEKIPLDSDHSTIVKFDNKHSRGYTSVREKLRMFERDAPKVIMARFLPVNNGPRPTIMIPFQRDCAFVGREDVIMKIRECEKAADNNHNRMALTGLGGVGKSQIAIEHAYRVRESAPQTWVFWIHAANAARFEQGYRDIADRAEIPGREDPKADILNIVYNWLCSEKSGQWLMILDNADDDGSFFDQVKPLESYLAQTPNGRILITSRNKIAAINLVGSHRHILQVEPMDEEDALALLNTRVPFTECNKADAKALVWVLECIPLAITHAAAYIKARARMTVPNYLRLFKESEANQVRLLGKKELQDLRRDNSIRHAVIATWQMSFTQIQRTDQSAADLLALMSMFDRQGIPISLLRSGASQLDIDDALEPLLDFSLVREEIGKQSVGMHRLVQLAMRKWLETDRQLSQWTKESRKAMNVAFPDGDYATWADCQTLFPHAKEVISHGVGDEGDQLNQANVASKTGWFLYLRGEYKTAETMYQRALQARQKVLGPEHPDTLASIGHLGLILESLGRYEEAELMHRRDLEGSEKVLGPEHPDTLTGINNLGSALASLGRYEDAAVMHRRALEAREKVLGPEHPDTLISVSHLGLTLASLNRC